MSTITKFTTIPTNFIYLLDNECYKLMSILIQKESYWKSKGRLKDGWFVKTTKELSKELGCMNNKDVSCTIQSLVDNSLIEVAAYDGKRMSASFRICWDIVNEMNDISLFDIEEFSYKRICKLPRNAQITYNKSSDIKEMASTVTDCIPTINNINNNNDIAIANLAKDEDIEETVVECNEIDTEDNIINENDFYNVIDEIQNYNDSTIMEAEAEADTEEKANTAVEEEEDDSVEDFKRPTEESDICDKLRIRWVSFIDMHKILSWIVQPIRTQTKCGSQMLISLQEKLNEVIAKHGDQDATAKACYVLWNELTDTIFSFDIGYKPANSTERKKYSEIVDAIYDIGKDIAFICKRKHLTRKDRLEASYKTDKYLIEHMGEQPNEKLLNNFLAWSTFAATCCDEDSVVYHNESDEIIYEEIIRVQRGLKDGYDEIEAEENSEVVK